MSADYPRRWGWHRLTPEWARYVVDTAAVSPGTLVIDLGAGCGALTEPLRARGARVLAVELHPGRAEELRGRYSQRRDDGAREVSVLELDLLELRLPRRPFRVVANPPWSLAVPLLRRLTTRPSAMLSAHLVLQRELVADVAARSRAVGPDFTGSDLGRIPPHAFVPPPPGRAALLELRRTNRLPGSLRSPHRRRR